MFAVITPNAERSTPNADRSQPARRRPPLSSLVVLLVVLAPAAAHAHGQPVALDFWGGYSAPIARCQRAVSRAAAWCAARAVEARTACLTAQLDGETCDGAATDRVVQAVRSAALDQVDRACSDNQLRSLQFLDRADALNDVTLVCRDAENAAVSAAFGPALIGGTVATDDADTARCVAATAQGTAQLLRLAVRLRQRGFDTIAEQQLTIDAKRALLDRTTAQIAHARTLVALRVRRACPGAAFESIYAQGIDPFLAAIGGRADCFADTAYAQGAVRCAAARCGNAMQERGEACDDGNDYDGDACRSDCTANQCEAFADTYDLIQQAIFERHGCTNTTCHGNANTPSGGLDLRAGRSYANLIDAPSQASELSRVFPGEQLQSLLWLKLAAKTVPDRYQVPLSPMPLGLPALSADELDAVRLWIHAGAPRTGTVPGTGELLDACLPPPEPIAVRPPAPPPPGEGVQLHMPRVLLAANSEREVCYSSYYDFTGQVPPEFLSPDGKRLRFNKVVTTQNPLSHHMVVLPYKGDLAAHPPSDPAWGVFQCAGGPHDGESCDPVALGACGAGFECATVPTVALGCVGYGPPDAVGAIAGFGFAGAQETVVSVPYAAGVYAELPIKGMIVWNSHAFNLTHKTGTVEGWVNLSFAPPDQQIYPAVDVVDISALFNMTVPAFAQQELCQIYTAPQNAHLFELSSHTHRHGKRFRIFSGAYRCAGSGAPCAPLSPALRCGAAACVEASGRTADETLLYSSFLYNDPVVLRFDPPMVLSGSDAARSLTYCSLYDNGATNPSEVKRQSTSPLPGFPLGGPCATPSNCMAGTLYAPCSGSSKEARDRSCDSSPGAGDGLCDACTLLGGVTTEDEMFVLLARLYVP